MPISGNTEPVTWICRIGALFALLLAILGLAYIFQPLTASATGGVKGELAGARAKRVSVLTAPPSHGGRLRAALRRTAVGHSAAGPLGAVREATYGKTLYALATFTINGAPVVNRFSWHKGEGWKALGPTDRVRPTGLPAPVLRAWHFKTT